MPEIEFGGMLRLGCPRRIIPAEAPFEESHEKPDDQEEGASGQASRGDIAEMRLEGKVECDRAPGCRHQSANQPDNAEDGGEDHIGSPLPCGRCIAAETGRQEKAEPVDEASAQRGRSRNRLITTPMANAIAAVPSGCSAIDFSTVEA